MEELGDAFAHLGLSAAALVEVLAAQADAMEDFNACIARLPNGRVITDEQMEEAQQERQCGIGDGRTWVRKIRL